MKLKIHNPINRVTGSCYELEYSGDRRPIRILVDCGIYQGEPGAEALNRRPFPFTPSLIDVVVLTHAHLDHCGLLPRLYREGFEGKVFCTRETAALAQLVLEDAARHGGTHTAEDVAAIRWFEPVPGLRGGRQPLAQDLALRFFPTGHILGACAVQFEWGPHDRSPRRLTFSGDLGPCTQGAEHLPLLLPGMPVGEGDYCVVESTYGGTRRSAFDQDLEHRLDRLELEVKAAFQRRGVLVMPCFAIGRTQDVLLDLQILQARGRLPNIPVFFDAVMAGEVSEVYAQALNRKVDCGDEARYAWLGRGLFSALGLDADSPEDEAMLLDALQETFKSSHTPKVERRGSLKRWSRVWQPLSKESAQLLQGPAVVVTGGGMCDGGRVQVHLRRLLTDASTTVLLTGYAAPSTIAGRLLALGRSGECAKNVRLGLKNSSLCLHEVQARIRKMSGYSAHADQAGLLSWLFPRDAQDRLQSVGGRRIFITHGEPRAREGLARAIREHVGQPPHAAKVELPGHQAGWFDLDCDAWVSEGARGPALRVDVAPKPGVACLPGEGPVPLDKGM